MSIHTIDCHYLGQPGIAAAFLMLEGDQAAFIETNTSYAIPALLESLASHGLSPEDVAYIIVTHIHLDHAGGAGQLLAKCPNATLLAHPRAAPHAVDPSRLIASARQVYGDAVFDSLYGTILPAPAERVRAMDDEQTLVFGTRTLRFLHTRGHANHHMVIHDSATNTVFTGDSFGIGYPICKGWLFPSTSPTDFDAKAACASVDRIVATGAEAVWLTHTGRVANPSSHADALKAAIQWHQQVLVQAEDRDLHGEALDRFCADRVGRWFDEQLALRGLGPKAAEAVTIDRKLNAQGIAAAIAKRRYKRSKGV